jgi:acyl carrier protein
MNDIRSRLIRCFSAVFPDLEVDRIPQATPGTVGSWDSLASLTLLTVIEEEFVIGIDIDDLSQFLSFDHIFTYLDRVSNAKVEGPRSGAERSENAGSVQPEKALP